MSSSLHPFSLHRPLLFVVLGSFVSPRPFVPFCLFNSIVSVFRLLAPYATCFLPPFSYTTFPLTFYLGSFIATGLFCI
ncbi:hypothetical protein EDB83DRAFT_2363699 [Lactarius deliciosus]|nr:hypothetical protein EDB83DRAFT_2363699 [Lactarius deliciosus]